MECGRSLCGKGKRQIRLDITYFADIKNTVIK